MTGKCCQEARATRSSWNMRSIYFHSVVNNSELYGPTNSEITYNLLFDWVLLLFFVTFSNDFTNVCPSLKIYMSVTEFKKF